MDIGTRIGNYAIQKKIGGGRNSEVFLARNLVNGQAVALKVFAGHDQSARNRLLHEAQLLKKLAHPNILQVLDSGTTDDAVYIVTDYFDGITINELIPKDRGLPLQDIWPFMTQIAQALEAAHQLGIVHLDLKPSNILVIHQDNADDIVKLIDFGIAKEIDAPAQPTDEKPWGTPGYVAPERILHNTEPDIRSDVYSLGALLAFFLTGQRPFSGDLPEQILAKQLAGPPDVLNRSYLNENDELQQIIIKATQKDPYDRYLTVSEMMEALSAFHRTLLFEKTPFELNDNEPSEDPSKTGLGHFVIGGVIIFIICFFLLLYFWLFTSF